MYASEVYARLCKVSYEYEHSRETVLHELLGNKFQIVSDLSSRDVLVLTDGDIYIVAFRGTDLARDPYRAFADLIHDLNIAIGKNDRVYRIQEAQAVIEQLLRMVPKEKIEITGHSLGGFVGINISQKYGLKAVLFNIGSSPLDKVGVRRDLKNVTHYTTNDLRKVPPVIDILSISALFLYRTKYYIVKVKPGLSNHTINNFI